ncbi:MAG: S8 family serine peptidase, partial [Candidatus Promineifilaceae bacterium]
CGSVSQPAAIYDASFSVGATNNSDAIASFSSRGPAVQDGLPQLKPDISAPGVSVRSSLPGDSYGLLSGTSMAAPHVAGLVALLVDARPDLAGDVTTLESLIEQSAVPLTTAEECGGDTPASVPNHVFGWGRIDALAAFEAAQESPTPTPTATATVTITTTPPATPTPTATVPVTPESPQQGIYLPLLFAP